MGPLIVLIPDRLSELVGKGEITERYYNPGNLFQEVHLFLTNDDKVDPKSVQKMVGNARLEVHNFPFGTSLFLRTLGWRPSLLKNWAQPALAAARKLKPALMRCHGNYLNGYLAYAIKQELGVPYVVSLHTQLDEVAKVSRPGPRRKISGLAMRSVEKLVLQGADLVLPVYESIIPYVRELGAKKFQVVYNVLNPTALRKKEDYTLHRPARILSVGNQIVGKAPAMLLRALPDIPDVELTLVGDGPLHESLEAIIEEAGIRPRVRVLRSMPNDALCGQLPEFDLFVVHSDYAEISKTVLEALLTGLPVILNHRPGAPVPELNGDYVVRVENSPRGYREAIQNLLRDDSAREALGRRAYAQAETKWRPGKVEEQVAGIYRGLLENNGGQG